MAEALAYKSHPVESRAVDWLSASFLVRSDQATDDLLDFAWVLGQLACPGEDFSEPKGALHYAWKMTHPGGIAVSWTPTESAADKIDSRATAGSGLIEITGRFWGGVTGLTRQQVMSQLRHHPGFRKCTRMDVQVTNLNPVPDALEIARQIEAKELWAKGFTRSHIYVERDRLQRMVEAVTIYLGSKKSAKRVRIYDKAAKEGWDTAARRVELQARAEYADGHFRWLVRHCENDPFQEEALVTAESDGVGAILAKEVQLKDTSAWTDRELPQNWVQLAPTPGWWRDAVASPVQPDKVSFLPPADLAASVTAMVNQFGRKVALEAIRQAKLQGTSFEHEMLLIGLRAAQRIRKDDFEILKELLPPEHHEGASDLLQAVLHDAAEYTEEEVEEG